MSSTYVHYGTPASLPADYGLLARYAATQNVNSEQGTNGLHSDSAHNDPHGSNDLNEPDAHLDVPPTMDGGHNSTRRMRSVPALRAQRPSFGASVPPAIASAAAASETTPLLIPRIEEDVDEAPGQPPTAVVSASWEELKVLSRYTLPILG
jgi:MATE family multidrug resistance protein